ncbi:hypothetical protein Poli38472_013349 [Pythium oligandrum]|uniref:Pentatricopeptide repeat domain-containing protein n=1 Tax=Pythium oligandrum TaxID=41045 RepID=A0A8K1C7T5_PYTOL|nr:hypothetical protein Poli38472_013349 [Pythium oligandrum]|eukprot:TMW57875.1 hypothetical protein Poli38472_013349 [Pythium oligandrum]
MWTRWHARRGALGPATRLTAISAPQRAFWKEASGLIDRFRASPTVEATQDATSGPTESSASTVSTPKPVASHDPPHAALQDLFKTIRRSTNAKRLMVIWNAMAKHQPFVVEKGMVRVVDNATQPNDRVLLQMVPVPEMLQLARSGERAFVVERAPAFRPKRALKAAESSEDNNHEEPSVETPDLLKPGSNSLLLSETLVAHKLFVALERLGEHKTLVQFFETLEQERRQFRTLELLQTRDETDRALVTELAALSGYAESKYIASLNELNATSKIVKRCEPHLSELKRYMFDRDTFRSMLRACAIERHGALARALIDQAMDRFPLQTFNVRQYTSAIHASLRAKPKTFARLEDALHVYRRMRHDAGYVLAPSDWSMLFNSCVYLDNHDAAMEVFTSYREHGIAPFQTRFEQALRTTCRFKRYETVLAMVEAWLRIESEQSEESPGGEVECFNKILWEMLKGKPTLEQVEQVLRLMERRHATTGAIVLRRIITHFLQSHEEPDAAITRFLSLWETCPNVIQRNKFVLYLILEQCETNHWNAQSERVIAYSLDQGLEMPLESAVKVMESFASRGELDKTIELGESILASEQPRAIPDKFFESLLKSYHFRQRFDDVVRVAETQTLSSRYQKSPTLAAIVRDAESMLA